MADPFVARQTSAALLVMHNPNIKITRNIGTAA